MDKYVIALLKCKGIGNVKVLNYILKYNKNIDAIKDNIKELIGNENVSLFNYYILQAENEILQNKNDGIKIISIFDNNYPEKLLIIKDPILYLYYKGDISLLHNTSIAVIGSRNIDKNVELLTRDIAKKIASNGITVVSGLALGTDINAHIGSYNEKGRTIAILPSGLNVIVPRSNKSIADNILKNNGLLVSEYSLDVIPTKYSYVKRDRIQAALSDAVIVIKSNESSGTMNAVKVAQKCNKYVTQYIANNNKMILNNFDNTVEDIDYIIDKAKNQKYKMTDKTLYEQETLF